jgi:hypothetical protein
VDLGLLESGAGGRVGLDYCDGNGEVVGLGLCGGVGVGLVEAEAEAVTACGVGRITVDAVNI